MFDQPIGKSERIRVVLTTRIRNSSDAHSLDRLPSAVRHSLRLHRLVQLDILFRGNHVLDIVGALLLSESERDFQLPSVDGESEGIGLIRSA